MTTPKLISWQDAIRAIADGKIVEHRSTAETNGEWFRLGDCVLVSTLKSGMFQFRLAEDPKPEPMRAEDWPAFFWVRFQRNKALHCKPYAIDCSTGDLWFAGAKYTPKELMDVAEYSTDRKTWKPCNRSSLVEMRFYHDHPAT